MQANHLFLLLFPPDTDVDHFFQRHVGTVIDLTALSRAIQQRWIDERAGIDDNIRLLQSLQSPNGNRDPPLPVPPQQMLS